MGGEGDRSRGRDSRRGNAVENAAARYAGSGITIGNGTEEIGASGDDIQSLIVEKDDKREYDVLGV